MAYQLHYYKFPFCRNVVYVIAKINYKETTSTHNNQTLKAPFAVDGEYKTLLRECCTPPWRVQNPPQELGLSKLTKSKGANVTLVSSSCGLQPQLSTGLGSKRPFARLFDAQRSLHKPRGRGSLQSKKSCLVGAISKEALPVGHKDSTHKCFFKYDCELGMQQIHRESGAVRSHGVELRNGSMSVIIPKLIWDGQHSSLAESTKSKSAV
ncbi:hypothetical protein SUGI_0023670 [Cryptomeria japonica]|nr:hypothetical protein SUGI_0023670 [Cryptomeria japonica]